MKKKEKGLAAESRDEGRQILKRVESREKWVGFDQVDRLASDRLASDSMLPCASPAGLATSVWSSSSAESSVEGGPLGGAGVVDGVSSSGTA